MRATRTKYRTIIEISADEVLQLQTGERSAFIAAIADDHLVALRCCQPVPECTCESVGLSVDQSDEPVTYMRALNPACPEHGIHDPD
jgi:hypothetical protein